MERRRQSHVGPRAERKRRGRERHHRKRQAGRADEDASDERRSTLRRVLAVPRGRGRDGKGTRRVDLETRRPDPVGDQTRASCARSPNANGRERRAWAARDLAKRGDRNLSDVSCDPQQISQTSVVCPTGFPQAAGSICHGGGGLIRQSDQSDLVLLASHTARSLPLGLTVPSDPSSLDHASSRVVHLRKLFLLVRARYRRCGPR